MPSELVLGSVVALDDLPPDAAFEPVGSTYEARRAHRLQRAAQAERETRHKKEAAQVEAAVHQAVVEHEDDPDYYAALAIVTKSLRHVLRPEFVAYLDKALADPDRAGRFRWKEMARFELWLRGAALPERTKFKLRPQRWNHQHDARLAAARKQPRKTFALDGLASGRTTAAIYAIAQRAGVQPRTVTSALLVYGLERLAQSLRAAGEAPQVLRDDEINAFPVAE